VRDKKIHVICTDGSFETLPDDIRKLGPWQSLKSGDFDRLKTHYRLQLAEQGFVVIHQDRDTPPHDAVTSPYYGCRLLYYREIGIIERPDTWSAEQQEVPYAILKDNLHLRS
jgi:hypothetical protein